MTLLKLLGAAMLATPFVGLGWLTLKCFDRRDAALSFMLLFGFVAFISCGAILVVSR